MGIDRSLVIIRRRRRQIAGSVQPDQPRIGDHLVGISAYITAWRTLSYPWRSLERLYIRSAHQTLNGINGNSILQLVNGIGRYHFMARRAIGLRGRRAVGSLRMS